MMSVYFVQAGAGGLIKIGFTENLKRRLANIKTSCPDMRLLTVIDGDKSAESAFHFRFKSSRVEGEWFSPSADILEFIETQPKVVEISTHNKLDRKLFASAHPLARWIKSEGITGTEFAIRAGLAQSMISMICTGAKKPGREVMQAIRNATFGEVSADDLLDPPPQRHNRRTA
jgi:hypothetical protein